MRLNLGTLALSATLLVNAGEVQAGQKGRTPLAALQQEELEKVKVVIMTSMLSEEYTPQHEATAQSRGYGTYHNPASGAFYVYSEEMFRPVDTMASLGVIFRSTQDSSPDAICFSAITFVDEFTRDGQRILVLDEASITDSRVSCPEEEKEEAVLEYKPQSGKFADLEPERIQEGLFWAPMLVIKTGEDVPDELTTTNYITSTQVGGSQTVYKKYTLKNYSPETGVLELLDPVDEKKCLQTRVFKDRIIGVPTRYILSEPGTPEMQEVLCEEEVSVSAAPSVPASSAQDPRSKPALRATLLAGLEIDEVVDQPSFGPSAEVAGMFTIRPFNKSPFSVGAMADIIISPQGSGFEGAHVVAGRQGDLLGIYGLAGVASEPRWSREDDPTTPEIERDPFDGVFAAGALVTVDMPFKGPLGATCGVSGELVWGGGDFPLNVAALCGGTFDLSKGRKNSPAVAEQVPVVGKLAQISVKNKVPPTLEKAPRSAPLVKGTREAADYDNWSEALACYEGGCKRGNLVIEANQHKKAYAEFKKLEGLGVTLRPKELFLGATAARGLGDIAESYRILQILALQDPNYETVSTWVPELLRDFSWVELEVPDEPNTSLALLPDDPPFPPDQRAAILYMNTLLKVPGSHTLMLPKGAYTLGGQKFSVQEGQTVVIEVKPSRD